MSTPSAFEQSLFELINRARLDPLGEFDRLILDAETHTAVDGNISAAIRARGQIGPDGQRLGVDLELLAQQFAALDPVAPLAWNADLAEAAEVQTEYQIATDQQSHAGAGGKRSADRALDAGYQWPGGGVSENVYAYGRSDIHVHAGFFIDWSRATDSGIQEPAGHRDAIMRADHTEIGIAAAADTDPDTLVGPYVVTEVLGHRAETAPQLLGVVIADADGDAFYDIGEGLGGVTVTATGDAGTFTTTTWDAGGYQLPLGPGSYEVTFSGGDLGEAVISGAVEMGAENLKLDAVTAGEAVVEIRPVATGTAQDPAAEPEPAADGTSAGAARIGTDADDDLTGTDGADTIAGLRGDDAIDAGAGDDMLSGSDGADTLEGGPGDDGIGGGAGGDILDGGHGDDTIGAGRGDDIASLGEGSDLAAGGSGADLILGGPGADTVGGGDGADSVGGGTGGDSLGGGAGRDTIAGDDGDDAIGGGAGDDAIEGGAGHDFLAGGGRDDHVGGGSGDDTINGGDGNDVLTGGPGADVFVWAGFRTGQTDRITDFEDGVDVLRLAGIETEAGAGLDGRLAALGATDMPGGTVLSYAGHTIEIIGLDAAGFDLADIIFV